MKEIIDLFGLKGAIKKLSGGQGESIRIGNYALKPVTEIEKYTWTGQVLETLPDSLDLKIARPIRSKKGNFTENSYGVTQYLEGTFLTGHIPQKIAACQILNELLASVQQPSEWVLWSSPWQWANQIAWQQTKLPADTHPESRKLIELIQEGYQPIQLTNQLIHSDLAGNILFNESMPVVIDFSPEFRPAAYAEVLTITDSIAWHNENPESLWHIHHPSEIVIQLALRAVIFRLSVNLFFQPQNNELFNKELKNFLPVINFLK